MMLTQMSCEKLAELRLPSVPAIINYEISQKVNFV